MSIAQDLLYQLAVEHGYDGLELTRYAEEDHIGGYHWRSELSTWGVGSLFESEGQMLYALIRYLKPQTVVEIGSFHGCSTAHMALALKVNGSGKIIAVDDVRNGAFHDQFPEELKPYVESVVSEGGAFMEKLSPESVDFVFEDSSHSEADTYRISKAALVALRPGGLLVNHDALHDQAFDGNGNLSTVYEGKAIRAGLKRAGAEFKTYLMYFNGKPLESDCGIAVTRKPKSSIKVGVDYAVEAPMESEQVLKPSEPEMVVGTVEKTIPDWEDRGIKIGGFDEPLAAEVDHIKAEQFALSNEPEPLAKEEYERRPQIAAIDNEATAKKKRGRKPKAK